MFLARRHVSLLATALVFIALYATTARRFPLFLSRQVFVDLLTDNSVLGIVAVGLTFVILSGGIDLSVGAVVGATATSVAVLVGNRGWNPAAAALAMIAVGTAFGSVMGLLIHRGKLPPFLVTLAGMFFARGAAFLITQESVSLSAHPLYVKISDVGLPVGGDVRMPLTACLFLLVLLAAVVVAHYSHFGRSVYAVGGNEEAAKLMGLRVGRTRILTYALSGFCAALAGVVHTFYSQSGKADVGTGLELDAIAAVVMGGTLLSGGVGYVAGTLFGVLIFGVIQTAITFQGNLNSWWTRIVVAGLLLGFILLQRLLERLGTKD